MSTLRIRYKLYWVRLSDEKGNFYMKEDFMQEYENEQDVIDFVNFFIKEKEVIKRVKLKGDAFYQQIPREEYIMDVVGRVCKYLDLSKDAVLSKLRDRELAYARKMISAICVDMKLTPTQICKKTGFSRSNVYRHIETLDILSDVDPEFNKRYLAVRNKIIPMYLEDGSGERLNQAI